MCNAYFVQISDRFVCPYAKLCHIALLRESILDRLQKYKFHSLSSTNLC